MFYIQDAAEIVEFDWVITAIPSNQVVEIMPESFLYKESISNIKIQGCYVLMLGF